MCHKWKTIQHQGTLIVSLLNSPVIYNYVENLCGPVNNHGTQNSFIFKMLLLSEIPL